MNICKIQFETRYTHILDFHQKYKTIFTPYLNLDDLKFTIENTNTVQEYIVLKFEESFYHIQCRMDRMIFIYEGDMSVVRKSNSPIKLFFDILEKILAIDIGIKRKFSTLAIWAVEPIDQEVEVIRKKFESVFLNKSISEIYSDSDDYAIVLERNLTPDKFKLTFGLYSPDDLGRYNLSPFKADRNDFLKSSYGLMAEITNSKTSSTSSFSKFKEMFEESEVFLSKINL